MTGNSSSKTEEKIIKPLGESRRQFIKALGVSGTGLLGIKSAIQNVYGEEPDGVPLVHTRDRDGNPKQIRYASKERYRRLKLLESLDRTAFRVSESINGITAESLSNDEDDLAIKLYINKNTRQIRRKLPNQLKGVPITIEERTVEEVNFNCSRDGEKSHLKGNVAIEGASEGTLGFVGRDANDDSPVLITANHIVESELGHAKIYQPYYDNVHVGDYADHSPTSSSGYDICKYDYVKSRRSYTFDVTKEPQQPDISGTWTYTGLQDYLRLHDRLACSFAGQHTCYAEANCTSVAQNATLRYEASMDGDYTVGGDSGGPWVDDNGNLICTHSGDRSGQDFGPVAEKALNAINAKL